MCLVEPSEIQSKSARALTWLVLKVCSSVSDISHYTCRSICARKKLIKKFNGLFVSLPKSCQPFSEATHEIITCQTSCVTVTHNFANRAAAMGRSNRNKKRKKEPERAKKEEQRALPSTNALKYDGEWFPRLKSAMKCHGEWFDRLKWALKKRFLNPEGTSDNESVCKRASSPENRPRPSGSNVDELSSPDSVKWASRPNGLKTQIQTVFEKRVFEMNMKPQQKELPLLKDLDSYLAHLPRREDSEDPKNPLIESARTTLHQQTCKDLPTRSFPCLSNLPADLQ